MNKKLLVANWKMHHTRISAENYFANFFAALPAKLWADRVELVFAVPYTLLATVSTILKDKLGAVAAQNMHWLDKGAYTGEVSLPMLADLGVGKVVLGHSERRQYYGESDESVALKVKAALQAGFSPIVCIGEILGERQAGKTSEVIAGQLAAVFAQISTCKQLIIAYEPVWAIGTGLAATSEQAQEVHQLIRQIVTKKFPEDGSEVPLIYGGSVTSANIAELMQQAAIDGALVGGASLSGDGFAELVNSLL